MTNMVTFFIFIIGISKKVLTKYFEKILYSPPKTYC